MSAAVDYAQAGELKFGQVGIANLRVRTLDVAQLVAEMRDRVQRAPNLFARAAVVLDFGGLGKAPSFEEARTLLDAPKPMPRRPRAPPPPNPRAPGRNRPQPQRRSRWHRRQRRARSSAARCVPASRCTRTTAT